MDVVWTGCFDFGLYKPHCKRCYAFGLLLENVCLKAFLDRFICSYTTQAEWQWLNLWIHSHVLIFPRQLNEEHITPAEAKSSYAALKPKIHFFLSPRLLLGFSCYSSPTHIYLPFSAQLLYPYVSCLTLYFNAAIHFSLIHLLCNWIFTLYGYSLLHD